MANGGDDVFVGSIDQGTTSTRFLIFNRKGQPVAVHQEEFEQIYPKPGWHEHNPEEIIDTVTTCIAKAVDKFTSAGHPVAALKAIGITNQRETTVVWDRATGRALHNAIVWTDTRTHHIVAELKARPGAADLAQVCGEPLSTYPSATKLLWLLRNVPAVRAVYDRGDLAFGTVDAWLIYRLNGGREGGEVHVSDPTNASRTMFMDLRTLRYSEDMLDFFSFDFDLRRVALPRIVKSSDAEAFGKVSAGPLEGVRIMGCLGDQSAALVGQMGFEPGSAKNTYGTGCFLLYNVGTTPVISTNGLLSTVAYSFPDTTAYALEGSIAVAGSGVKFLTSNLSFASTSSELSALAASVPSSAGLVFVTAFSGLFAPYWIPSARGTLFGVTAATRPAHIARAALDAVCFQTKAILDAMARDSGHALAGLRVDGGMSDSDVTMQGQADAVGIPIVRPEMRETTALGAAVAAGVAAGVWAGLEDVKACVGREGETRFERKVSEREARRRFGRWERAVRMTEGWIRDEDEDEDEEKEEEERERAEKEAKEEAA